VSAPDATDPRPVTCGAAVTAGVTDNPLRNLPNNLDRNRIRDPLHNP
jgi:hypothetical protein